MKNSSIDILPLAAVALTLVLIMMVVSPLVISRNSTPVNLPQTHTAERKVENDLTVSYTVDGRLLVDDKPVLTLPELESTLHAQLLRDPYVLVVIRADKECLHSRVLDILAVARRAGALRIACATKKFREG